jgi:hypothetical protein
MKRSFIFSIAFILFSLFSIRIFGQGKVNVKYGKISPLDFVEKVYNIDSNANAVVIADIGKSEFVGDPKSGLTLQFHHFKRIHILNKSGYGIANVGMLFFVTGTVEENLLDLKAHTYNFENGSIVETKLDRNSIYKDNLNKYFFVKKFTFPNVKEGSIIEYEYTIKSDFFDHLRPWEFQGEYPCLWSEYSVTIPQFYNYEILKQGYQPFTVEDKSDRRESYNIGRPSDVLYFGSAEVNVTDHHWIIKNVPALKMESFTSALTNYINKIEFQLESTDYPLVKKNVMGTWRQLSETLLQSEYFGLPLSRDNNWLNDIVTPLMTKATSDIEKAKLIFYYVRDNLTCTNHSGIELSETLKNILKNRRGSVSDINLLLTAMLKYAKLDANPVILSTRQNGYAYALYPVLAKFNYVVTQLTVEGQNYYLDASQPHLGFAKLLTDCYNGHARLINSVATPLDLNSDSLNEKKVTSIDITSDTKGNWIGTVEQRPGYYESFRLRDRIKDKEMSDVVAEIEKEYGMDARIEKIKVDSLENYDEPLRINYELTLIPEKGELIYINPMLCEAKKENPFKSAERYYPVEMPYASDESYVLSLKIPEEYLIEEMPKPTMIKLNEDNDGIFEYRISESAGTLYLFSRLRIKRADYSPEEYTMLREFFNLVVKKQNEQIVLKKKK